MDKWLEKFANNSFDFVFYKKQLPYTMFMRSILQTTTWNYVFMLEMLPLNIFLIEPHVFDNY